MLPTWSKMLFAGLGAIALVTIAYHLGPPKSPTTTERPAAAPSAPKKADVFGWPTDGLPAEIADALNTTDLAPTPGNKKELTLGVAGENQIISTSSGSAPAYCGSAGCSWDLKDAGTRRVLIDDEFGSLHRTSGTTRGFYDLLVEEKSVLVLYKYNGDKYVSAQCYTRSDGLGSSGKPTPCELIGDPTQPTALSPETRDVSSVLRTERQIEGSEHEQRLAALRKKREGLERAFRIEIELGNKITRDAYNLSSQPMADPDERQYLMESMDKIKQEMAKLVREIKETDAEIAREQQPPTPPEEQRTPEPRRLDSLSPSENSGPLSSGTPPPAPPADTPRPW